MIYCLHYIQQKKAEDLFTIDMVIPLREVKVDYYVGDKQVVSVKDVVTGCALPFKILADGYVQLTVEELRGYCVLSVQTV